MQGHVRKRGKDSWEYIADIGMHAAERCQECGRRFWIERRPRQVCPKVRRQAHRDRGAPPADEERLRDAQGGADGDEQAPGGSRESRGPVTGPNLHQVSADARHGVEAEHVGKLAHGAGGVLLHAQHRVGRRPVVSLDHDAGLVDDRRRLVVDVGRLAEGEHEQHVDLAQRAQCGHVREDRAPGACGHCGQVLGRVGARQLIAHGDDCDRGRLALAGEGAVPAAVGLRAA